MLAIAPVPTLLAAMVWALLLGGTGRSSVASLVAAMALVGLCTWWAPHTVPGVVVLAIGIGITHISNIRRLMAGEEAQVVRSVRWGRKVNDDVASIVDQGPGGKAAGPLWKEAVPDPMRPERDISLTTTVPPDRHSDPPEP